MNEEKTMIEKKPFTLPNKKVKITPIIRKGGIVPPSHEAAHLFGTSSYRFFAPIISKDRVAKVLTEEEEAYLSKVLKRDLSEFKEPKENYWMKHGVRIYKQVKVLNLADPQDYVDYKILLLQKDIIAPTGADKYKKGTYKFVISDLDYEDNNRSKTLENKQKAYKFSSKLSDGGKEKMGDFLSAYYFGKPGKRVPDNAQLNWLASEIDRIIESDLLGFLAISEDPDYDLKLTITKAINRGVLNKDKNRIMLPEGGLIATNMDDLLLWFKDPVNSEEVTKIEMKVS